MDILYSGNMPSRIASAWLKLVVDIIYFKKRSLRSAPHYTFMAYLERRDIRYTEVLQAVLGPFAYKSNAFCTWSLAKVKFHLLPHNAYIDR